MNHINRPTLLIDKIKAESNIQQMMAKANHTGVVFRPHFKTHQSIEIGKLFRKQGVNKITVSSVEMARFFAEDGWNDITIAFPVNLREINEINNLAARITLNLLAESVFSLKFLETQLKHKAGIFIKIDTGYHRTGLEPDNPEIQKMIDFLESSQKIKFLGFLTHAGHTYHAKGKEEVIRIMDSAKTQLIILKKKHLSKFPNLIISYGDTPSCSMAEDCSDFDEIRPGNFVYYDVMQYHLGSCNLNDIAVIAACPVVAVHPQREELVIYGGAVHLSKEAIEADNGFKLYGYVVPITETGWGEPIPGAYVSSLSQEHGIIKMPKNQLQQFKPGGLIGILPIHSCLTANLLNEQTIL
jgi:D-serine deaminase-like pyridoxal phosphate-dependent protein